jgi:hypothetical protein
MITMVQPPCAGSRAMNLVHCPKPGRLSAVMHGMLGDVLQVKTFLPVLQEGTMGILLPRAQLVVLLG